MPKSRIRIGAFLLSTCLVADSVAATAPTVWMILSMACGTVFKRTMQIEPFAVEALSLRPTQHQHADPFLRRFWGLLKGLDIAGTPFSYKDARTLGPRTALQIGFHPLRILKDKRVLNLFTHIIHQRLDTQLFSIEDLLRPPSDVFTWRGHIILKHELVKMIMEFLASQTEADPLQVAQDFWKTFDFDGHSAEPSELRAVQSHYDQARDSLLSLPLIKDVLSPHAVVADIGAGKNTLGPVILAFSDRENLQIQRVIGVDIFDWRDSVAESDSRLKFRLQQGETMPLEPNSIDVAILKWSLHHMDTRSQQRQIEQVAHALKPGGRLIVLEALMASEPQVRDLIRESLMNPRIWPPGPGFNSHRQFTVDYLHLKTKLQRAFLALEDYYGHILVRKRMWMPLPFTYLSVDDLHALGERVGLHETMDLRRIYGLSPIFLRAPPTARLVFEKSYAAPLHMNRRLRGSS